MKEMGRFILKCILALLPLVFLVGYICINPMGYMDEEFPSWYYTKQVEKGTEKFENISDTVLILGDSRAMADIVPTEMGENYVNLGMGGATSVEMYYTLKHFIENNGVPDRVFIMFAPFHYSYMDNFKTRTLYFHHLKFPEVLNIYNEARALNREGINTEAFAKVDLPYIVSCYLRLPSVYLPALINSGGFGRYSENTDKYDQQVKMRGHGLYGVEDGCDELNYEANYTGMKKEGDHRIITVYFRKLMELCMENEIECVVLQTPMNEASYNALDKGYVSEYFSYINALAKETQGVYFEMEIPCYSNEYFGDASHLNEKGAYVYTQELIGKYIKQNK
ncbi:MAG: hypothetical protein K6E98_10030 [Lachnospiraceae bacterium]|nr:hypothetical protein [Lachnospiraceae bacterium]